LAEIQVQKLKSKQEKLENESEIVRVEAATMLLKQCKELADAEVVIDQIVCCCPSKIPSKQLNLHYNFDFANTYSYSYN